jgi:hypothetical protein
MELFLNLAWAVLAIAFVSLWLETDTRTGAERRLSMTALVMFLVILFPVISVSDDLWSIQNPAETDSCQRRDHLATCPHTMVPAPAVLPPPLFAGVIFKVENASLRLDPPMRAMGNPALRSIQNRPPPYA